MDRLFKLPDFRSDDLNITAWLNYYLAAGFVLLSLLFVIVIPFLVPELTRRSAFIAGVAIPISLLIMMLVRRKKLQLAGYLLLILLWLTVTVSSITAGGVSVPILIGYLIIVMVSGLLAKRRASIIIMSACIVTAILIVIAEINGILPDPIDYSPVARISVYIFFFAAAAILQSINASNTRQLLSQAQRNETRYQSLLENIPAVTYINSMDTDARTEYVSPQIEKLLGYPRSIFKGDPLFWMKILHPDDVQRVIEESRRTSKTLESFKIEYRVLTREQRVVWLKDEAAPVYDENGKPLYWLGIWTDITILKQSQEEQSDLVDTMTKRTIQLQTAAEVARAASSMLNIDELLPNVVELIRDHFDITMWACFSSRKPKNGPSCARQPAKQANG